MKTCKDCRYYEKPVPIDAAFFCNKHSSHYAGYRPCKDFDPKENDMNKMIEKLKDKNRAQPFFMRSEEEQAILIEAGPEFCLTTSAGQYPTWNNATGPIACWKLEPYILKPDYQPEPEYEDIEIIDTGGILGIQNGGHERRFDTFPYDWIHLHVIPSLPQFHHFCRADNLNGAVPVASIARIFAKKDKVYARFVRSKP